MRNFAYIPLTAAVLSGPSAGFNELQQFSSGTVSNVSGREMDFDATGNTLAVGCNGRIEIWKRSNNVWSLDETVEAPAEVAGSTAFGRYPSLSADGTILVTTDFLYGARKGFVFRHDGNEFQLEQVFPTDNAHQGGLISKDGSRLFMYGTTYADSGIKMFEFDGNTWNHTRTINDNYVGNEGQLKINADGTRVILAKYNYGSQPSGSITFYHDNGSSFVAASTFNAHTGNNEMFGKNLSVNDAGTVALVSAPGYKELNGYYPNTDIQGQVYIYKYENGSWVFKEKLIASNYGADLDDNWGHDTGISADGSRMVVVRPYGFDTELNQSFNSASVFDISGENAAHEQTLVMPHMNNVHRRATMEPDGTGFVFSNPYATHNGASQAGVIHYFKET